MIKFVGIDLDGTLLDSHKRVSEENMKAIEKMERYGIKVTLFTGRTWIAGKRYLENISNDVPAVFQNGAYIVTSRSQKVMRKIFLESSIATSLVKKAREYDFFSLVTTNFTNVPDMIYEKEIPQESNFIQYFERNLYRTKKVKNMDIYLKNDVGGVVWVGPFEKIMKAAKEVELSNSTMVVDSVLNEEAFVEFFGKNCGKEVAMKFLLKHFNISLEEAAFIGDSYNDLGVLKMVSHPIVMENAPDDIKKIAEFVTLKNDENGVSHAVYNFILKKEMA